MAASKKDLSYMKEQEKQILEALTKLGGSRVQDDALVFEGTRFVLPENMTVKDAIDFLEDYEEQNEEEFSFVRTYPYLPWDGAAAFERAMKRVFGTVGIGKAQRTFFGKRPPQYRTIMVDVDRTMQIPWGEISIPMIHGAVTLFGTEVDGMMGFGMQVQAIRKFRTHVEGLFVVVEEELKNQSIYRGKTIADVSDPHFIDLSKIDESKVIYADETERQLDANVWSMLRHADRLEELGIPLKRSVLFEGEYGTGKTLAAFLTAKEANRNGWTFIYGRPQDDMESVFSVAKNYQPCVVFFEDVDSRSEVDSQDQVTKLLDLFDGIQTKGTRMLVVLTTNHVERIHKGMVRPGRLDAVIHIGSLDESGVMRLIEATVPEERRSPDLDRALIGQAYEGFVPAFAKEAIDRAIRYAVSRTDGGEFVLTTDDFVEAANGLRPQLDIMNVANEDLQERSLDRAFRNLLQGHRVQFEENGSLVETQTN